MKNGFWNCVIDEVAHAMRWQDLQLHLIVSRFAVHIRAFTHSWENKQAPHLLYWPPDRIVLESWPVDRFKYCNNFLLSIYFIPVQQIMFK